MNVCYIRCYIELLQFSSSLYTVTMAGEYLTNKKLREIIKSSAEYEISDEDESDAGDNVEGQTENPDELEMANKIEIKTYFLYHNQWQSSLLLLPL